MRITRNLKHWRRIVRRIKAPKNFGNRLRESPLRGDYLSKSGNFWYFWGRIPTLLGRLRWNFAQPSGPRCPSVLQSLTWICATSRPCGSKNLIFGLWVKTIPAVCRYAAIQPVKRPNIQQRKCSACHPLATDTLPLIIWFVDHTVLCRRRQRSPSVRHRKFSSSTSCIAVW